MIDAFARLADAWPAIATVLHHSQQPWPEAAIRADWAWWNMRRNQGEIGTLPGRHTLAKRWGWRENRVRLFLVNQGGLDHQTVGARDGSNALPPASTQATPAGQRVATSPATAQRALSAQNSRVATRPISRGSTAAQRPATSLHPGATGALVKSAAPSENARTAQSINTRHTSEISTTPNAGSFSSRLDEKAPTGTQVDLLSSLSSPSLTTGIPLERAKEEEKKGERPPPKVEGPRHPALDEFLRILNRWAGDEAPAERRWTIHPSSDCDWFLAEIVPTPEAAALDLVAALKDWDEYLERTARSSNEDVQARFPRQWKLALKKQIQLKAAWEMKHGKGRKQGAAGDRGQRAAGDENAHSRPTRVGHSAHSGEHRGAQRERKPAQRLPIRVEGGSVPADEWRGLEDYEARMAAAANGSGPPVRHVFESSLRR